MARDVGDVLDSSGLPLCQWPFSGDVELGLQFGQEIGGVFASFNSSTIPQTHFPLPSPLALLLPLRRQCVSLRIRYLTGRRRIPIAL